MFPSARSIADKWLNASLLASLFSLAIFLVLASPPAKATPLEPLPAPTGKIVLSINGRVVNLNAGSDAVFDMPMLMALQPHMVRTETPWTEGAQEFEGPLLRDILAQAGADGAHIKASAVNDYSVIIPMEDVMKYDVILAHTRNGIPMRLRDKGPLWVIYPWHEHPELRNEVYYARSIWQARRLVVE